MCICIHMYLALLFEIERWLFIGVLQHREQF